MSALRLIMGVLGNSRHELFAQELAKGTSATAAYALAGFKPNDGNCIRLKGNERVLARVRELKEAMAEKVIISKAEVLGELAEMARAEVDEITARDKFNALQALGKHLGLFNDKVEHIGAFNITITAKEAKY